MLFPISSLFWWYFEYINRFVQNWFYVHIENFSSLGYTLHATICFGTVLPAVMVTRALLLTFPGLRRPLPLLQPSLPVNGPAGGLLLLLASMAGLTGLACRPDILFPLVWLAPLLVLTGLELILGRKTIFSRPDLDTLPATSLAALICGFFWEMWNWRSLAHWEYAIPYVDHLHLFAMPLPGYLGYLPFGLECLAVARLLSGETVPAFPDHLPTGRQANHAI